MTEVTAAVADEKVESIKYRMHHCHLLLSQYLATCRMCKNDIIVYSKRERGVLQVVWNIITQALRSVKWGGGSVKVRASKYSVVLSCDVPLYQYGIRTCQNVTQMSEKEHGSIILGFNKERERKNLFFLYQPFLIIFR